VEDLKQIAYFENLDEKELKLLGSFAKKKHLLWL